MMSLWEVFVKPLDAGPLGGERCEKGINRLYFFTRSKCPNVTNRFFELRPRV